jgi:hypothetical protein
MFGPCYANSNRMAIPFNTLAVVTHAEPILRYGGPPIERMGSRETVPGIHPGRFAHRAALRRHWARPSGGFGVDDQFEFGRLDDRQVRRFCAFENPARIEADLLQGLLKVPVLDNSNSIERLMPWEERGISRRH